MLATTVKAILHLILLVFFSLVLLWILFYFHGTGFNSLLIPEKLWRYKGGQSPYIGVWYILSTIITYIEWFGLVWLVNKFNYWYGKEWLKPTQMRVAKVASILVGLITAVCVAAYYITSFANH